MDDVLAQVVWTQIFLKEQGYEIHDNVIYPINQSTIKLGNNGRQTSSKRTRQTNIRYYFITGMITKQEASVELYPTLEMIGNYSRRHCRDLNFFFVVITFLVSMMMIFPSIIRLE